MPIEPNAKTTVIVGNLLQHLKRIFTKAYTLVVELLCSSVLAFAAVAFCAVVAKVSLLQLLFVSL